MSGIVEHVEGWVVVGEDVLPAVATWTAPLGVGETNVVVTVSCRSGDPLAVRVCLANDHGVPAEAFAAVSTGVRGEAEAAVVQALGGRQRSMFNQPGRGIAVDVHQVERLPVYVHPDPRVQHSVQRRRAKRGVLLKKVADAYMQAGGDKAGRDAVAKVLAASGRGTSRRNVYKVIAEARREPDTNLRAWEVGQ